MAEEATPDVVYRSRVRITRHRGPDRTAALPVGEEIRFGVHSEVADHYGVSMETFNPTSTTLDYLVAAAGG